MFEIDNVKFGAFISELRKQKGFTQKELSMRLFISDKAISKWERGLSLPDITLAISCACWSDLVNGGIDWLSFIVFDD